MTNEEIIKNKAKARDDAAAEKVKNNQKKLEDFKAEVRTYTPLIKELIKTGNTLLENGFPLNKGYGTENYSGGNFYADGWSHKFGFKRTQNGIITAVGRSLGDNGEKYHIYFDGENFDIGLNTFDYDWQYDKEPKQWLDGLKNFVNVLSESFELDFTDSLKNRVYEPEKIINDFAEKAVKIPEHSLNDYVNENTVKLIITKDNLNKKSYEKFDKYNNLIYLKNSDGYEVWKEYDENNNLIHSKNSNGYEIWQRYDENNNLIYFKNSHDLEEWQKYDENNNLIYLKHSDGYEVWKEYDENNNLIHSKDSNGYEIWQRYDENNNLIYLKNSDGLEEWKKYDENNNLIYFKNSHGLEEWQKYDENNNLIYFKNSDGYEIWKKYDENNNLIFYKNSESFEVWKEYDENNNLIHLKDSRGFEVWREVILKTEKKEWTVCTDITFPCGFYFPENMPSEQHENYMNSLTETLKNEFGFNDNEYEAKYFPEDNINPAFFNINFSIQVPYEYEYPAEKTDEWIKKTEKILHDKYEAYVNWNGGERGEKNLILKKN